MRTLSLAIALLTVSPVYADARLDLARSFVAEVGWRAERDWAAMAHVHQRRAERRRVPLERQVREYCSIYRVRTQRARWVLSLSDQMRPPQHWPAERASWHRHRAWWQRALDAAAAFLHAPQRVRDPCRGRADHFGGPMDRPSPAWSRVDCGRTRQLYYTSR